MRVCAVPTQGGQKSKTSVTSTAEPSLASTPYLFQESTVEKSQTSLEKNALAVS